ncbi:MAG: hypothetical protein Q7J34_00880 [Bacteroidales bacterium]|jgi:hypothetical protein|nr:hypothetical protein [Bacteroidales bacterium]
MENIVNIGIIVAYILIAFAVLSLIGFALLQIVSNFKRAKNGLIGLVVLLALFLVAFLVSPAEQGPIYEKLNIGPTGSQVISSGLIGTYALVIGIIGTVAYTEVSKWFR